MILKQGNRLGPPDAHRKGQSPHTGLLEGRPDKLHAVVILAEIKPKTVSLACGSPILLSLSRSV